MPRHASPPTPTLTARTQGRRCWNFDPIHLRGNDGSRVHMSDFKPLSEADAKKMSRKKLKFCEGLVKKSKDLIRTRQAQLFKHSKILLGI
ncbi:hypothethical protein (plasmid) [Ralstonia solanacearum CMR15]|nr:hypothethical protein [Ralstonia solanacearum CMR15]